MKSNKMKPLLILCLFFVVSCSNNANGYLGTYKFQMGSDKGTHMGVYMDLTSEDVTNTSTNETLGKKFVLSMDMDGDGTSSTIMSFLGNDFKINGYYNIDSSNKRLYLGISNFEKMLEDATSTQADFNIPSSVVEKVMYATIDSNVVNVYIPVSLNDALFQLYWYGYRIGGTTFYEELDQSKHHEIGSHPTKEDVDSIIEEEKAKGEENNRFEEFRDYHTLSMGLTK